MIENDENIDEKRRKKVAGLIELNGDLRFFNKREAGDPLNWMSPLFESGLSRLLTGSTKFYRTDRIVRLLEKFRQREPENWDKRKKRRHQQLAVERKR